MELINCEMMAYPIFELVLLGVMIAATSVGILIAWKASKRQAPPKRKGGKDDDGSEGIVLDEPELDLPPGVTLPVDNPKKEEPVLT